MRELDYYKEDRMNVYFMIGALNGVAMFVAAIMAMGSNKPTMSKTQQIAVCMSAACGWLLAACLAMKVG